MIFKRGLLALLGVLVLATSAEAFCSKHLKDVAGERFQFTYNCQNSNNSVKYQIIRHLTHNIDFEFFTFDPSGWNLMCSKLIVGDTVVDDQCLQTGLRRKNFFSSATIDFSIKQNFSAHEFDNLLINMDQYTFIYPKHVDLYTEEECAVIFDKKSIRLFTPNKEIQFIAPCLLQYEIFRTNLK